MKRVMLMFFAVSICLAGCQVKKDVFVGKWENKGATVPWIKIEADGDYYKVSSPVTGPIKAIKREGILYISDCEFRQPVYYNKVSGELIYADVKYKKSE